MLWQLAVVKIFQCLSVCRSVAVRSFGIWLTVFLQSNPYARKRECVAMNEKVSISNVVKFAGAFIAFLIGSGFATGQEILQYFTAYGLKGLLTALVMVLLFIYVGASFIIAGVKGKLSTCRGIFKYY